MPDGRWVAEFYEGPSGETPVEARADNLSGVQFAALDAAIKYVLEPQGLGLASGKWLTALGGGVYEFRIRHSVSEIERMYAATTAVQAAGEAGTGVAQAVRPLLRPADHLVAARLRQGYR